MNKEIIEAIRSRRSIREFTGQPVTTEQLREIVSAGIWAPSGLNNQPWRFVLVRAAETKEELAAQTTYGHIVRGAAALIGVFLDEAAMYEPVKDHQAAGACIQNMLLATEAIGLGGVWLGQILKNKEQVRRIVGLPEGFDLMALLAIGYPLHRNQRSNRKELSHFILREIDG